MRTLSLLLALAACAPTATAESEAAPEGDGEPAAQAPIVLTWAAPAGGAFHAMGAEGTLERDGRCLYLRTPSYRFLLVFPEGTRWDADAGGVRFGDQLLRVGSRVSLSGDSRSGAEAVAPGFDARGCDDGRIFRVAPWLAR